VRVYTSGSGSAFGFFGDLWDGIKSAGKTVYKTTQKVAASPIGQAVLKGVDLVAATEGDPPGLISGAANTLLDVNGYNQRQAEKAEREAEEEAQRQAIPESELPPEIQQYAQEYRESAAPTARAPRTYDFPTPPVSTPPNYPPPPPPPPPPLPPGYGSKIPQAPP
jgi:hypothetical protein